MTELTKLPTTPQLQYQPVLLFHTWRKKYLTFNPTKFNMILLCMERAGGKPVNQADACFSKASVTILSPAAEPQLWTTLEPRPCCHELATLQMPMVKYYSWDKLIFSRQKSQHSKGFHLECKWILVWLMVTCGQTYLQHMNWLQAYRLNNVPWALINASMSTSMNWVPKSCG